MSSLEYHLFFWTKFSNFGLKIINIVCSQNILDGSDKHLPIRGCNWTGEEWQPIQHGRTEIFIDRKSGGQSIKLKSQ